MYGVLVTLATNNCGIPNFELLQVNTIKIRNELLLFIGYVTSIEKETILMTRRRKVY